MAGRTYTLTELDLLIGRIVVSEEFPEAGWIGLVLPDAEGKNTLQFVLNHREIRGYIWNLLQNFGEQVRRQIEHYRPDKKRHRVFFTPLYETETREEARTKMLRRLNEL